MGTPQPTPVEYAKVVSAICKVLSRRRGHVRRPTGAAGRRDNSGGRPLATSMPPRAARRTSRCTGKNQTRAQGRAAGSPGRPTSSVIGGASQICRADARTGACVNEPGRTRCSQPSPVPGLGVQRREVVPTPARHFETGLPQGGDDIGPVGKSRQEITQVAIRAHDLPLLPLDAFRPCRPERAEMRCRTTGSGRVILPPPEAVGYPPQAVRYSRFRSFPLATDHRDSGLVYRRRSRTVRAIA